MASAFEELKESRDHLKSLFSTGKDSENFQEDHTEIIDQYFRRSLQESKVGHSLFKEKVPFAFVAIGGYGRRELCLHSDIDILILFRTKIPSRAKVLVEEVFFPLWDLGLDVGYGTRTIKDCLALSKRDFEVLSSMMDARFICGDSKLYLSLIESFEKKVLSQKAIAFTRWLEDRNKIRMEAFGDASNLLEPNLKEGIGGLRDYHHILWLGRVFFNLRAPRDLEYMGKLSHNEYQLLRKQLKFVWLVRNHLHELSGRKNDRLVFEYQEEIAKILGYQDQEEFLAVEQFMGKLHASMSYIKSLNRAFVHSHVPKIKLSKKGSLSREISDSLYLYQEEINFHSAKAILSDPLLLIEIFEQSACLGYPLSLESKRLVGEFLYLVGETFRTSVKAAQRFIKIINSKNTSEALDQMFETGFLNAFIPEFKQVRDRVHFDTYHIFPVGRHLLETVRCLKQLTNQSEILLLDIFEDLSDPEIVLIAGLFHDIGKISRDHARKGVGITQKILNRMGFEKKQHPRHSISD